ncbi:MAG: flagellar type III secretion system pore protein FliP [bacterium]|nr:flagellar type III secretion system pore protein FliP [bacterium]
MPTHADLATASLASMTGTMSGVPSLATLSAPVMAPIGIGSSPSPWIPTPAPYSVMPVPGWNMGAYLAQVVLLLVVVVAVAWIGLVLQRRAMGGGWMPRSRHVRVVDRLMVDPRHALWIVAVGKRHWLAGTGEQGWQLLSEVSATDLDTTFEGMVETASPEGLGRRWWHRWVGMVWWGLAAIAVLACLAVPAMAQAAPGGTGYTPLLTNPFTAFDLREPLNTPNMTTPVMLILLLAVGTILPFLVIMTTSFIRTTVVLGFLRQALGTQSIPPNPVMLGLSLFLAMYTMAPVWQTIDQTALQPFLARTISQPVMLDRAQRPLKEFMLRQTAQPELAFFTQLARAPLPAAPQDVPLHVVIPAFMVSELTTAFKIGFMVYIPFIVIDLVVSNVLLALGMSSLPPQMISNAFKLLIFTLANGWHLIMAAIVQSFR